MTTRLEFRLTEEDRVRFFGYFASNSPTHISQARIYRFLPAVLWAGLAIFLLGVHAYIMAAVFFAMVAGWILIAPWRLRKRYEKIHRRIVAETSGRTLAEPLVIELEDAGVRSTSAIGDSLIKYAFIGKIVENAVYTYVFIDKGQAHVLPHDRLGKPVVDEFISELKRRMTLHAPPPLPSA
jgi:hypothetical protein